MEVRELSQVDFLSFIAAGLRRSKKWRDGARGGRYGKVREPVNVLTGTECLTLAHSASKTAHKKIWRKFHIHFPKHTIALFLK